MDLRVIARIHNDFSTKFGVPRQSGLAPSLRATIVFEPTYRNREALRGIEGFSHLWLLWGFDKVPPAQGGWHPTVRPPRLGGNERLGVFATRSPFRPNPLGLSCVSLLGVEDSAIYGPVLLIGGADMVDGTPVYDIKPYLPQADCIPSAVGGFTDRVPKAELEVECAQELWQVVPQDRREALREVLSLDPRPAYQHTPQRVYGFEFAGFQIRFTVEEPKLYVVSINPLGTYSPEISNVCSL